MKGFFVDWPNPPTPEQLFQILKNSYAIILAIDTEKNTVIGFVNALSDKVIYSYIPLLEVLPEYQKKGIGKELIKKDRTFITRYVCHWFSLRWQC